MLVTVGVTPALRVIAQKTWESDPSLQYYEDSERLPTVLRCTEPLGRGGDSNSPLPSSFQQAPQPRRHEPYSSCQPGMPEDAHAGHVATIVAMTGVRAAVEIASANAKRSATFSKPCGMVGCSSFCQSAL